ncbi:MAG: SUMF1/EgtB/PvdO family nonheme iron enzyme [Deltaproteobacteria bacterium]
MRRSIIFFISAALLATLISSVFAAEVRNMSSGQEGKRAFVQYDLAGMPGEKEADVEVHLEVGGMRYTPDKLSLSGDFGKGVKVGVGRRIWWDLLKDMPAGFEGEIGWDVEAAPTAAYQASVKAEKERLEKEKAERELLLRIESERKSSAREIGENGKQVELMQRDSELDREREQLIVGKMISVPAGCFSPGGVQVCLDSFRIAPYEVTQKQWQLVMGNSRSSTFGSIPDWSRFKSCGDDCPVESVSWDIIQEFLQKLNNLTGKRFRLPSEAEWHYACTSGGKSENYCGGNNVDAVAWYDKNSGRKTHPVGAKKPNGLGVYDMSGNVWEWVNDWYGDSYPSGNRNPTGTSSGDRKVIRGGSWLGDSEELRADYRFGFDPSKAIWDVGFRLVISQD